MRTLFAIALGLTLVTSAPTLAATSTPIVYLALGDSLAAGVGASSVEHTAYVPRLFQYFRGTAHGGVDTLVNLGISGDTSSSFLNGTQLVQALAAINDPLTDTRIVTLDIGGNDLLNTLFGDLACLQDSASLACRVAMAATLAAFAGNYQTILSALNAALATDPGAEQVFVMTYYNAWGGTGSLLEPLADALLLGADLTVNCLANADPTNVGLNDLIACIGIGNGMVVVDGYAAVDDRALHLTHIADDDIHPNSAGYAAIAKAFIDAEKGK